jgi:hypothetical protein
MRTTPFLLLACFAIGCEKPEKSTKAATPDDVNAVEVIVDYPQDKWVKMSGHLTLVFYDGYVRITNNDDNDVLICSREHLGEIKFK